MGRLKIVTSIACSVSGREEMSLTDFTAVCPPPWRGGYIVKLSHSETVTISTRALKDCAALN